MQYRRPPRSRGGLRYPFAVLGIVAVVAIALGLGIAFAGQSGSSHARPMEAAERDARRMAFLDEEWADVAANYPEALRPDIAIGRTVDDRGRREAIVDCLVGSGIAATVSGSEVVYSSSAGQTQLEVAVSFANCSATFPTIQRMTEDLDTRQLGALWDYYTGSLRPCLAASGYATWRPPDRVDFVAPDGHHTWNPYFPLRDVRLMPAKLDRLDRRCPAVPRWLDFRTP